MAKAMKQETWTLEDLPRLASEQEAIGQQMQRVAELVQGTDDRLTALEKIAVNIDSGERQLPSEVVAGLNPGQIFATALSAAIQNVMTSIPTFNNLPEKNKRNAILNAVIVAELTLSCVLERMPAKKVKSA